MDNEQSNRKEKKYTEAIIKEALKAIEGGLSLRAAAKKYGIARSSLSRKAHLRTEALGTQKGPSTVFDAVHEDILVNWIKTMARSGFPVSKETLMYSVTKLARDLKLSYRGETFTPKRKWYEGFLRRHPDIALRTSQNLTSIRGAVTQEEIHAWFNDIWTYLVENNIQGLLEDPRRVFNADETAFFLNPKPGKVLAEKGSKTVYTGIGADEKLNLTVLLTANSAGDLAPPMIVYRYARIPLSIAEATPSTWGIGKSENGWMTQETFYEYIANIFEPWLTENQIPRPVVFFLDGYTSHSSYTLSEFCKKKGIELVALFPNATHLLQPMDVAVFHTLKQTWRQKAAEWRMANEGRQIQKQDFPVILQNVLQNLTRATIESGFRACGLVPWDPSKVKVKKGNELTPENISVEAGQTKLKVFLEVLRQEMSTETYEEFERCRFGEWNGDIEKKELFKIWKSVSVKVSELRPISPRTSTSAATAKESEVRPISSGPSSSTASAVLSEVRPISRRPSTSTASAEVSEVRPISPIPSTSTASAEVSEVRPISPIPSTSAPDPIKSSNATHELTPRKKLLSCAVERPMSAPPNIPSPFKRNLFWPNPEGVTPKRLKRERLPAVTTSPQVMAYFKSKEEKKKALEAEKAKKRKEREEKKESKGKMLKKKDPPTVLSSPSSTEEGSVQYCEESDDWNESEGTDEEMASISNNLEVGKFVLVEVLGGKRNTSRYVYLCTVLELLEDEVKVQGFVSVDNMKNKFVVRENDEFIVPLCQIKGVILNSPEVNWVERKLTYIFQRKLPVNEKV